MSASCPNALNITLFWSIIFLLLDMGDSEVLLEGTISLVLVIL